MFRKKITYITLGLILISGLASAQESGVENKTKRQIKTEKRKSAREAKKLKAVEALADQDFVIKAREIVVNSRNSITSDQNRIPVAEDFNFLKIDGDEITVQVGAAERVSKADGSTVRVYKGTIERFAIQDKGEGKSFSAIIDFASTNSNNLLSAHLVIWGKKAQVRFYDGPNEILLEGVHGRLSESDLWNAPARIRSNGR